ncbi:MAG: formylglycine-generating enzyme family protein [Chloroflexi bacterium]|nr:formylglycine-generating enzyme family protein [Chloroflexota bacterium]
MTREADDMVMVYVPGGEFEMGSDDGESDEQPVHSVPLDDFWMDRTEVSNAQYARCVDARVCQAPTMCYEGEPTYEDASKADHPVICVDWRGAQAYCEWAGGQLPTEAQWEYAARGPDGKTYPWGYTFDGTRLNFCDANCPYGHKNTEYDDGYERTSPVDDFESGASWYGALNMAGNVWEWTSSLYQDYPYQASDGRKDPTLSDPRVLRGASWYNLSSDTYSAYRSGQVPDDRHDDVGFRCVGSSTSFSP